MVDVIVSFLVFSSMFGLTMVIHRVISKPWNRMMAIIVSYCLGFLLVVSWLLLFHTRDELSLSACVLYGELSLLGCIIYLPRIAKGQTPSSEILHALRTTSPLSEEHIEKLFSEKSLLDARLLQLKERKIITQKNHRYMPKARGTIVYGCIRLYEWFHGMEVGG